MRTIDLIFIVLLTTYRPIYLRPYTGVLFRNRESAQNFELNPFLDTTGLDFSNSVNHDRVKVSSYSKYFYLYLPVVGIEPATSRSFHSKYEVNNPNILINNKYHAISETFFSQNL